MSKSDGKWWDVSWNPVTGCTPISEGCANCWAKGMANRLRGRAGYPADNPFRVTTHADKICQPFGWKKPRRIFVCDMGDIFHKDVPNGLHAELYAVVRLVDRHTYLVLTKRPKRMGESVIGWLSHTRGGSREPIENLWLGVTCENQKWADIRIPELLKVPAAARFLSLEPLLGPIDCRGALGFNYDDKETGERIPVPAVDWVIVGCESGSKPRPCKLEWIESIVDQCQAAGAPVWVKQLSINGKANHDMNEWPEWARRRERPE